MRPLHRKGDAMLRHILPKPFNYFDNVRFFFLSLCVVLCLIVALIFFFIYSRNDQIIRQRVLEQARTYADLINHAKQWNYEYGGVYVDKSQGAKSNSYLEQLGIAPDVKAEGGKVFTIRNHAIMIKEISRQSEMNEGVRFRIVSLKPLDPANRADEQEAAGIASFVRGAREFSRVDGKASDSPVFRYITPLYLEKSCLECHRDTDGKIGGILGALSITIPMDSAVRESSIYRLYILAAALCTIGILVSVTYFLTWRLVVDLDDTQKRLKRLAATDELTGLRNRRTIIQRLEEEFQRARRQAAPLSVISLDIDHFKQINDTYGHPFGDLVLKCVADGMTHAIRAYDIIGRIGGEEFIIVAPGSPLTEATALAERVLRRIREEGIDDGSRRVSVTLSAGVALLDPGDKDLEGLLRRADTALYRAKHEGRNRCVVAPADA
jgi:diguanylate cyclase (GGDEF)-like protein